MYCFLSAGKSSALYLAQCGQVGEAYSITWTGALGSPKVLSWSVPTADFEPPPLQAARLTAANAMTATRRVVARTVMWAAPPQGNDGDAQARPVGARTGLGTL